MAFNTPKVKNPTSVTIGAQLVNTVVIGPIKIDSGLFQGTIRTISAGTTTPTAYTVQICTDATETAPASANFGNLPTSVTITASTTSGVVTHVAIPEVVCAWVRVISGAAFAAGTATLDLIGIEK